MLLTSNLAFSKCDQIFKDAMTTAVAIDRLVHHRVIIELNVPSNRVETAKAGKPIERDHKHEDERIELVDDIRLCAHGTHYANRIMNSAEKWSANIHTEWR